MNVYHKCHDKKTWYKPMRSHLCLTFHPWASHPPNCPPNPPSTAAKTFWKPPVTTRWQPLGHSSMGYAEPSRATRLVCPAWQLQGDVATAQEVDQLLNQSWYVLINWLLLAIVGDCWGFLVAWKLIVGYCWWLLVDCWLLLVILGDCWLIESWLFGWVLLVMVIVGWSPSCLLLVVGWCWLLHPLLIHLSTSTGKSIRPQRKALVVDPSWGTNQPIKPGYSLIAGLVKNAWQLVNRTEEEMAKSQ